jgi:hypothetical protein
MPTRLLGFSASPFSFLMCTIKKRKFLIVNSCHARRVGQQQQTMEGGLIFFCCAIFLFLFLFFRDPKNSVAFHDTKEVTRVTKINDDNHPLNMILIRLRLRKV